MRRIVMAATGVVAAAVAVSISPASASADTAPPQNYGICVAVGLVTPSTDHGIIGPGTYFADGTYHSGANTGGYNSNLNGGALYGEGCR